MAKVQNRPCDHHRQLHQIKEALPRFSYHSKVSLFAVNPYKTQKKYGLSIPKAFDGNERKTYGSYCVYQMEKQE